MALLTITLAAGGLAASTLLVTGSSRVEPVEVGPESVMCQNIDRGYQRTLSPGSHCSPRTEVDITPTP